MESHIERPLISCLCVTENRVQYLQRALMCFLGQSYSNREMVVVCRENDLDTIHHIESYQDGRLRLIKLPRDHSYSLGELRNVSIENAKGKYFCQWDDDDWYHKDRLLLQYHSLKNSLQPACMLTNLLMFDISQEQAYFSGFRLWENSVFGLRALYENVRYQPLDRSEDHEFMNLLLMESSVYPTIANNQYIYVSHGKNTWNSDHFNFLFGNAQPLSKSLSILIKSILDGEHSYNQACTLLDGDALKTEINYFYIRKQNLIKETEESKISV